MPELASERTRASDSLSAVDSAARGHRAQSSAETGTRDVRLFGIDVVDTTLATAAASIVEAARHGLPLNVAFLNAHCINTLFRDPDYRRAVETCDRVYADGSGMRIAARLTGRKLIDNVNGTDLFPVLCDHAAKADTSLYLLGGRHGVAAEAGRRMMAGRPGLDIAGTSHGFFASADDETRAIADINASGARIVLVGLGVPLQERWIARNRHRIAAPVVLAVGGLFDYYSGRIPRAPLALRRADLEWAWRLALEPRRLARRYILGNAEFLTRVVVLRLFSPDGLGRPQAG